MQFNAIEERVLRYLESRFVAGGGFAHVTSDELARDNRLQRDQFTRLMARFESLGILEEVSLDGIIAIKKVVCQHVAELDASPSPATVNILNIGHVSHSQIQQGTVSSVQASLPSGTSSLAQPSRSEDAAAGQVTVTDQTRYLRAERVSEADMQALTMANNKVVGFQGRLALLKLETSVHSGGKKCNVVELHFDQTAYGKRADGDYSETLGKLSFYEP